MQMTEQQLGSAAETLGPKLIDFIAGHVPGDEQDVAVVGVLSCVATALAMLSALGLDTGSAVAKIHETALICAEEMAA